MYCLHGINLFEYLPKIGDIISPVIPMYFKESPTDEIATGRMDIFARIMSFIINTKH